MDHKQTIYTSLQADNYTNTLSLIFYRPDALPDAKPTVSEHWRIVLDEMVGQRAMKKVGGSFTESNVKDDFLICIVAIAE